MFAPISARLASSCSRNGISAVATETICLGETSMSCTLSGGSVDVFFGVARDDLVGGDLAVRVDRRVGLRDDVLVFAVGREVADLVGDDAVSRRGTASR
jgi:hypothetical protein